MYNSYETTDPFYWMEFINKNLKAKQWKEKNHIWDAACNWTELIEEKYETEQQNERMIIWSRWK